MRDFDESGYNFKEIPGLRDPLISAIYKLGEYFEIGSYGCVIAKSRGGDIPALAIWEAANLKGVHIPGFFVKSMDGQILEQLASQGFSSFQAANRKALLVTEYIVTGKHIAPIKYSLRSLGVGMDVLTAYTQSLDKTAGLFDPTDCRLYYGQERHEPRLYASEWLKSIQWRFNSGNLLASPNPTDQEVLAARDVQRLAITLGTSI